MGGTTLISAVSPGRARPRGHRPEGPVESVIRRMGLTSRNTCLRRQGMAKSKTKAAMESTEGEIEEKRNHHGRPYPSALGDRMGLART